MSSVTSQRSVPLDRESVAAAARRRSTASRTAVASINDFAAYDPSDPKTGMAADPDVEMLFKSKSIADIKVIERNTRSECEQKKEELRLMVGERYRDMIDAADTILDMRDSVTSVVHSIESLLGHCQKIASSSTNPAHEQVQPALHSHGRYVLSRRSMTQIKSDTQRNIFYSVSTQMKLLVDAPEHLWNALEIKQYLKAAKLYLLSEYIYNVLRHNQSISSSLRSHFPILHTQWDSMSGLKSEIASKCALELRHCHVRVEHVASNLLSLILLDELSPTEILTKLLEIRLGSIKDTLSPAASHNPVHLRLLHCVEVVRLTIDQIFPMFVGGADGVLPLLYQYLKQHTAEREHRTKEEFQQIDMAAPPPGSESDISNATLSELFGYNSNTLTLFKHLPLFIQSFRPSLPQKRHVKVPLSEVRELCQQWVVACTDAIAHGVPLVLPAHRNTPTDSSTEAITDSAVEAEEGAHMLTLSELNACRQYILRVISYYCDPNAPQNPARDKQTQQHTHFAPHDTSAEAAATVVVPPSAQLARVHTPTQEGEFYDALSATAWATVCMQVLGHQLDLWDTLLRTPMLTQAQAILSEHFARVSGLVMDTAVDVSAESVSLEIDGRTVGVSAQWQEQDIDLSPVSKEEVTLTPRAREFLIALKRGQTFLEDDPAKADDDSADDSGVDVTEFALPKVASQATTYITLKASSISLSVYGVVAVFDLLVDAIVYDAQGYLGLEPYTGTTGQRGSKARVQETHSINQHLLSLTKGQQAHVHLQSPSAQGLTHTRNRNYDLALSDPTRRNDTSSPHARSPSNTDSASVDASRRSSETGSGFVNVGKVWLDSVSADALVMSERMGGECGLCVQALSAKLQALLQETANVPVADNNGDTTGTLKRKWRGRGLLWDSGALMFVGGLVLGCECACLRLLSRAYPMGMIVVGLYRFACKPRW
ncbi:hypothetical protein SARC_03441 [Sphaeroforma arctica JP610]|uniref:Conserved oligomeric Golgi complex subunit 1 n=1 Tax=Sphaeroforma arctica JP610 TaxID=667725 RepID=A0A0L0G652_9EUKA|nr:hypothetical protein SARC_03441 [Sphaeroforma arctica JP610]KNC84336.1 hypothetical protein SARC_03441 [Sphaeroforma arctica JP610]|eukprot:XP_014158238.1 hypothetical protein SARC_03441 [Sphaeroforma arctica JP610]